MLLLQIMFLTRIPLPFTAGFSEDDFVRGVPFAPVVGAIIGLFPAAAFFILSEYKLPFPAAASALAVQIMVTGALHLDGLADTADGFFSCRERGRTLEIMKDPRIGTNGVMALITVILMKFCVLLSLSAGNAVFYLAAVPAASRMTIAWSAGLSPYARNENGMGKAVVERTGLRQIVIATFIALLTVSAVFRFRLLVLPVLIVTSAALTAFLLSRYSMKKIGGVTGDVIGAVIEVTEVVLLALLLAAETVPAMGGFLP